MKKQQRFTRSAIALACTLCIGTHVYASLADGMVAYYPFDGSTNDISGNANHGLVNGNVSFVTGISGKGAKFNGVNSAGGVANPDYIRVPNSTSLKFSTAMSVSYWVRIDGTRAQTTQDCSLTPVNNSIWGSVLGKGGDRNGFVFYEADISSSFGGNVGGSLSSGDTLARAYGAFRHVAYTINGNAVNLYVNGLLKKSGTVPINFAPSNTRDLYIGVTNNPGTCSGFWYPLDGVIDELRIYNRALTAIEVSELAKEQVTTLKAPTCVLTPTPSTITAGQPATLTATCTPTATSYQWSDTACASTSSTCTVTPNITTNYSVKGGNSGGMGVAAGGIVTVYKTPELTIDSPEGFIAGKTITLKSNLLQLGIEYKMCIGTGSKNYNLGCHSVPIPFSFPMEANYDFYVAIKAIKNGVDVGFSNEVRVKGEKPIDPLLSTHWNQLAKAIDLDQDGKLTETVYLPGCTAVAIGQLINYYHTNGYERNWLDFMLSGVHVYPKAQVCNREKWNLRETCEMKSFDLTIPEPGYKLLPTYAKQNDNDVDDFLFQVALGLDSEFKKCGLLFGMAFGCATGSGGDIDYSNSKEELLQKYGMYTGENVLDSIMTLLKDRFRFSLQQPILAPWDETINESDFKKSIYFIISELNNSRPILFYLNADKSAHLTIIDGYRIGADGRPEFHINFGWGENDCNTKLWRSPFEKPLKAYKTDSCNDSGIRYSWKNAALLPASPMR